MINFQVCSQMPSETTYVLSHTTEVYQASYQSNHVRADLMNLAFGSEDGGSDELLFAMLRNVSMIRDSSAPIDILPEEEDMFESRQDMTAIRDAIRSASDKKERSRLVSKANNLVKTLTRLKVEDKRARYFKMTDNLRARGLITDALRQGGGQATVAQTGPIKAISALLDAPTGQRDTERKMNPRPFLLAVLGYLSNAPIATTSEEKVDFPITDERLNIKVKEKSRCFLCETSLSSRSALMKHCERKHPADTSFSGPFPCPECKRHGLAKLLSISARRGVRTRRGSTARSIHQTGYCRHRLKSTNALYVQQSLARQPSSSVIRINISIPAVDGKHMGQP